MRKNVNAQLAGGLPLRPPQGSSRLTTVGLVTRRSTLQIGTPNHERCEDYVAALFRTAFEIDAASSF